MAYKQHRTSLTCHVLHLPQTLLLESKIPHRQHFIYQQYLGLEMRCHSKTQPDAHTAGIAFDWCVNEFFYPGKINYLVKFPVDLFLRHSQNGTTQAYVLPPGKFRMKSGSNFQKATYAAV